MTLSKIVPHVRGKPSSHPPAKRGFPIKRGHSQTDRKAKTKPKKWERLNNRNFIPQRAEL